MFQGGNTKKPEAPAPKKRFSAVPGSGFHFGQNKENKVAENKPSIENKNNFNQNLDNIKKMFANRGPMGMPRQSADIKMIQGLGGNNIIKNEDDKCKDGYDPNDELNKKLDNIVVEKKKKKKKPGNFEE